MLPIRIIVLSAALALPPTARACDAPAPLSGVVNIAPCEAATQTCQGAENALYEYSKRSPEDPAVFSIALQSSPWRMYDSERRILAVDDVAAMIAPRLTARYKRVELWGSWTGVSLAGQLSRALKGKAVKGMDGFIWYAPDGTVSTTRQAFTLRGQAGPYLVAPTQPVMAALMDGAATEAEAAIVSSNDPVGLLHLGVGYDVYLLCPDKALHAFRASAAAGNAIGAYNAALILLERNGKGDRPAGLALLQQAAQMGDAKALERLKRIQPRR